MDRMIEKRRLFRTLPFFLAALSSQSGMSQVKTSKSVPFVDNTHPGLFFVDGGKDPTIIFNYPSGSCKQQLIIDLADRRTKQFLTNSGYACDGKLRQFRHSTYRFASIDNLIEALTSGNVIYRIWLPQDDGGGLSQDWTPFPRSVEVGKFYLSSEKMTAIEKSAADLQIAASRPSPDSTFVTSYILSSIERSPQLAAGRAFGRVKNNGDSVVLDMLATAYEFGAQTRNVKCLQGKVGKTCSYSSNVSVALTAFGGQVFRVESGWMARNDTFRSVNGKVVAPKLDEYTARIASTIGGGGSTTRPNEPSAGEKCRDRVIEVLQNQGWGAAAASSFCP